MTFYDQDDPERWPPSTTPAGTMPPVDDDRADEWRDEELHLDGDPDLYEDLPPAELDGAMAFLDEPYGDPAADDAPGDHDDAGPSLEPQPTGRHSARRTRHDRHDYVVLKGRRRSGHRLLLVLGVIALVLVMLAAGGWFWYQRQIDPPGPPGQAIRVVIPSGSSTSGIGSLLDHKGVIANSFVWNLYTSRKHAGPFRSGSYVLRKNSDLDSVIDVLEKGPITTSGAYLPAGLTVAEIESQLSKGVHRYTIDSIRSALRDGQVTSTLRARGQRSWEGVLYPGTYTIGADTKVATFLQKLSTKMEQAVAAQKPAPAIAALNKKWGLDLSTYDVLVTASLIQREAGSEAEMPKIATVIYNRLADGVPLGIDATSMYEAKQTGQAVDFGSSSPYNTRKSKGLPPTPISSIGGDALRAALHPTGGPWKYYVLVAKGKHLFTDKYSEFAKGVEKCKAQQLGCG